MGQGTTRLRGTTQRGRHGLVLAKQAGPAICGFSGHVGHYAMATPPPRARAICLLTTTLMATVTSTGGPPRTSQDFHFQTIHIVVHKRIDCSDKEFYIELKLKKPPSKAWYEMCNVSWPRCPLIFYLQPTTSLDLEVGRIPGFVVHCNGLAW